MSKSVFSISVSLWLFLSVFSFNALAQGGGDPPPPPPYKKELAEPPDVAPMVIEATLVLHKVNSDPESQVNLLRNLARTLLPSERISLVYRMGDEPLAIAKLADGETSINLVRYHKVPIEALTETLAQNIREWLITDGKKYFRIVLGGVDLMSN